MKIPVAAFTLLAGLHFVISAGFKVKAPLGGNATVRCLYEKGSERHPKYFSKGRPGERTVIVNTYWGRSWTTDDRFSLEDDRENREFTVTIRNLTVEDAGVYWCGVDWWGPDQPTEVNLVVVQDIQPTKQSSSTPNALLPTSLQTGNLLTQDNKISVPDQPVYLGVWLAVVVLLCVIVTVFVLLIKKNNLKPSAASTAPRTFTQSDRKTCIYEEIIPTNDCSSETSHNPDSHQQATHSTPSGPRSSATSPVPHPESVVYSAVTLHRTPPDDATPSPSAESTSLYYTSINIEDGSHGVNDTCAFTEKSHVVYATIKKRSDREMSSDAQEMAVVS